MRPSELSAHRRAAAELSFASALWGFSFIATRWGLLGLGPFWLNVTRFGIACAVALPLILFLPSQRRAAGLDQLRLAALPGLFLGMFMALQSYALQFTTVARNSFLVVLYIVVLPFLEWPVFGRKPAPLIVAAIGTALLGTWLMCGVSQGEWNRGDVCTLAAAMVGALHILRLEIVSTRVRSAFVFNVYQSLWAAVPPLALAVPFDGVKPWPWPALTYVALFILSIVSTLFAFVIQVRAQRVLPGSTAALIFLLESPFATVFGILAFGEVPSPSQWAGAALILAAAILAIASLTPRVELSSRSQPC